MEILEASLSLDLEFDLSPPTIFHQLIFEVRMSSDQCRKLAADCMERARYARKSEDVDAWLFIAGDWLRLAAEFDAPEWQSE